MGNIVKRRSLGTGRIVQIVLVVVLGMVSVTAVFAKSNVDWRELERSYPTAGIGWDVDAPHPGTQIFPNYLGSGVELTVNYSTYMWDETPNYYVEPDSLEPEDKHCHERYHGALRWTNNLNSHSQEEAGTEYGPTFVEFVYDQPVFISELEIGSLSIISTTYEWIRWTAYDENDNPVLATTIEGDGVYCDDSPTTGPVLFDDETGTYYAHGVAVQEMGGYDHLIMTYTDVPIKRVYAEFWKGMTTVPQGEHVGQLASITMHSIVHLPETAKATQGSAKRVAVERPFRYTYRTPY